MLQNNSSCSGVCECVSLANDRAVNSGCIGMRCTFHRRISFIYALFPHLFPIVVRVFAWYINTDKNNAFDITSDWIQFNFSSLGPATVCVLHLHAYSDLTTWFLRARTHFRFYLVSHHWIREINSMHTQTHATRGCCCAQKFRVCHVVCIIVWRFVIYFAFNRPFLYFWKKKSECGLVTLW